jgi:hypothetical protein
MSNNNEIKIGDTVDCSEWARGPGKCVDGKVLNIDTDDGELLVEGNWPCGAKARWVNHSQITRHVPAAPVVERPKSCGDKLASEMTVRERFIFDYMLSRVNTPTAIEEDIEDAETTADDFIAALDKERTP